MIHVQVINKNVEQGQKIRVETLSTMDASLLLANDLDAGEGAVFIVGPDTQIVVTEI